MQQWEYLVVVMKGAELEQVDADADRFADADKFTEQLNKYAQAGWELVSFQWEQNHAKAAFKRQKV
jgi:hypothetical protein